MIDPAHNPAHPARAGKVITCGPENVAEFNAELRKHCPEAFELAKALHAVGLISGLAGAKLAVGGPLPASGGVKVEDMVLDGAKGSKGGRK